MSILSVPVFLVDQSIESILCDWSELPEDLLALISNKLVSVKDFVRFGVVCVSWQSAFNGNRNRSFPCQVPFLMAQSMHGKSIVRCLYHVYNDEVYSPLMDVARDKCVSSSTHGWMVTIDPEWKVELINPFLPSNNKIELPALTFLNQGDPDEELLADGFMKRTVLSANPTLTSKYAAMTIYGAQNKLAFCKVSDQRWTMLAQEYKCFNDLIYFKDEFFAVDSEGTVVACDVKDHLYPKVRKVAPPPTDLNYQKNYIVESLGELLQVKRVLDFDFDGFSSTYNTVAFKIFKLDQQSGAAKWVEMKTLSGQTIFLGDNASFSASSFDFPLCKPNSIYFTDDARNLYGFMGPQDMGVYSLEEGIVSPNPLIKYKGLMPPPVWVEPTLEHCRHN